MNSLEFMCSNMYFTIADHNTHTHCTQTVFVSERRLMPMQQVEHVEILVWLKCVIVCLIPRCWQSFHSL